MLTTEDADPTSEAERHYLRADRVFGPHVGKLRELKLKYDPDNVFRQKVDLLAELPKDKMSDGV
jgi:hypothetical protein